MSFSFLVRLIPCTPKASFNLENVVQNLVIRKFFTSQLMRHKVNFIATQFQLGRVRSVHVFHTHLFFRSFQCRWMS
jgi:hypothetical protein